MIGGSPDLHAWAGVFNTSMRGLVFWISHSSHAIGKPSVKLTACLGFRVGSGFRVQGLDGEERAGRKLNVRKVFLK